MPSGVYQKGAYHPFTTTELVAFRNMNAMGRLLPPMSDDGVTRDKSEYTYETEVVDLIIALARGQNLLACESPSMCWKLNVIRELEAQYYNRGIEIASHPWSDRSSWPQVAAAAKVLKVDLCAGLDDAPHAVMDRMEWQNLRLKRKRHGSMLHEFEAKRRAWDLKYSDDVVEEKRVSASAKEQQGIDNAVNLLSDDEGGGPTTSEPGPRPSSCATTGAARAASAAT